MGPVLFRHRIPGFPGQRPPAEIPTGPSVCFYTSVILRLRPCKLRFGPASRSSVASASEGTKGNLTGLERGRAPSCLLAAAPPAARLRHGSGNSFQYCRPNSSTVGLNNRHLSLTALEAESPSSGCPRNWVLTRILVILGFVRRNRCLVFVPVSGTGALYKNTLGKS